MQRQQLRENGKNSRRYRHGSWRKSETKRDVIDGSLSSQEFGVGATVSETQRSSYTPRWHCERWFRIVCSIQWTRIINITNDCSKSNGCHSKTTGMRRTSSRRSVCLYPGQKGRCTLIVKNSEARMSRHLESSTTTQMAKVMVQYGRPSRSSWAKSVRSSFSRTIIMEKAIRESSVRTRLGKVPNWKCLLVHLEKSTALVCLCGRCKTGWKETKHRSNVENTHDISWFWRTDIIPRPCLFGLHSKVLNKQRCCRQLQDDVWIQNLCWSYKKATKYREIWRDRCFVVLWRGRSCKEMRWKMLRTGEQNNSTVLQSRNSMHGRPLIQGRRKLDLSENCEKYAHKLFWNSCICPELVDLIFHGPWTNLLVLSLNEPELVTNVLHIPEGMLVLRALTATWMRMWSMTSMWQIDTHKQPIWSRVYEPWWLTCIVIVNYRQHNERAIGSSPYLWCFGDLTYFATF